MRQRVDVRVGAHHREHGFEHHGEIELDRAGASRSSHARQRSVRLARRVVAPRTGEGEHAGRADLRRGLEDRELRVDRPRVAARHRGSDRHDARHSYSGIGEQPTGITGADADAARRRRRSCRRHQPSGRTRRRPRDRRRAHRCGTRTRPRRSVAGGRHQDRILRANARTSSANSSGCSHAAK